MIYFKSENGKVFAYETQDERERFGAPDLVAMNQEEVAAHLDPGDAQSFVPASVTMRQARLALHAAGLLSQVEAAIDALPETPRTEARIEWDFSSEVFRDRDLVKMLGASLGLTSEQLDDLFITAATL